MAKKKPKSEPLSDQDLKSITQQAMYGATIKQITEGLGVSRTIWASDNWKPAREAYAKGIRNRTEIRIGSLERILVDIYNRIKLMDSDPRVRVERWEILLVEREASRERDRLERAEYEKRRNHLLYLQAKLLKKQIEGPPAPDGVIIGTCTEEDYRRYWEDNGIKYEQAT